MDSTELRKAGLKITTPRLKILEILEKNPQRHMRAEDIYQLLKDDGRDVGLATVYRVLTQFEAADLVTRHHFESGQSVFELNQGEHHDHLVCVGCGRVEEFMDDIIEAQQIKIAQKYGYQITDHALNIYGMCGECQAKA